MCVLLYYNSQIVYDYNMDDYHCCNFLAFIYSLKKDKKKQNKTEKSKNLNNNKYMFNSLFAQAALSECAVALALDSLRFPQCRAAQPRLASLPSRSARAE